MEALGYQIAAKAASGEAAITTASRIKPDLVLMDIQLQGEIDGIEAAQTIYEQFNIPVVYLTAHSDDQTLAAATRTNAFGYLLKPFQARELHTTIQIALQRHEQEALTNALQEWLSSTLNSIGDATITTDRAGCVTFMNPIAEHLTGWSQDEALGQPIHQVLPLISTTTRKMLESPVLKAMALNQRVSLAESCLLRSKTGAEIQVQDTASPITTLAGVTIGSIIVLQDMTQHEIARLDLWQRNQDLEQFQVNLTSQMSQKIGQFEQSIAYISILVQMLDERAAPPSGKQRLHWALQQLGEVLDLDYAWIALHDTATTTSSATVTDEYITLNRPEGTQRASIVGQSIAMHHFPDFYQLLRLGVSWIDPAITILPPVYAHIVQPDDQLLICPIITKQIVGQVPVIAGEVGLIATGRTPWPNPLQVQLITQIVSYAASVTRQSELEGIAQAQKVDLEVLNYLKEDFISSISHALKTPLENMQRAIEMMQYLVQTLQPLEPTSLDLRREQSPVKHKLVNYLQILKEEWQSEYDFVNDLLNLKAPLTPIEPMYLSQIQIQPFIAAMFEQFAAQAERFGQTLNNRIEPPDLTIYSHLASLEKITKELLNNALKYTPPNQQICVSTQVIDQQFELRVTNTGITIPTPELEKIFQPFYRIPRRNPWDYRGTGLGLALVRKLVLRLEGTIQVESCDQVTTLIVQLPALTNCDA